ncbi:MAG: VIT1/CCC1 transporter family protein [Bacteroidales bacterium]|nr:VIT1/CCC1 transporter family protein [Bacteroidales bacterium]
MKNKLKSQLQTEVDASYLYKTLGKHTEDQNLAGIYFKMSEIEEGHAQKVLERILPDNPGVIIPGPSARAKLQVKLAGILGFGFIQSGLLNTEKNIADSVIKAKATRGEKITGSEYNHVKILDNLSQSKNGASGGLIAKLEGRHKSVGGNALRAAVLGANDGLVSNLSLIMGVAGATIGNKGIIIAGFAGLLAGAISMALGEWLSVQSSRELYLRQIQTEMDELENSPEEEALELSLIYQSKGIEKSKAEEMSREVLKNKDTALDTLVREELGIDINELGGSAWEAAFTSFILFTLGAIIPLLPFLFISGGPSVLVSLSVSAAGLFIIGSAITLYTGRGILFSGIRQVIFGLLAAAVTFGIGKLIGISIAG